jgi:antitoxin (DNA-binding transcriptional repressor) of toxin-antitoxin stability system
VIVNIAEAKTQLSKLVTLAFQGEQVVIAKNNLPLVELVPHTPKSNIVFGLLKQGGTESISETLEAGDQEIEALFYGGDIFPATTPSRPSLLVQECAKLNPRDEKVLADEGLMV